MSSFTLRRAIVLALAPLSTAAFAQDTQPTEPTVILDPVIVTASKTDGLLSQTPARVSVIGEREIRQNPVSNLAKVIETDAGISLKQSGGIGQISEISTRGTNANHTLVLKDGARLNSQNHLAPLYPAFFDLSDVSQIEIVKGPASVQYGADAVGGVVQMRTSTPSKSGIQITGLGGENNTYKALVKADLVTDTGLYASIHGQRLETDGTRILDNQNRDQKASYDQKGYGAVIGFSDDRLSTSIGISQNEGISQYFNYATGKNDATRDFENQLINAKASFDVSQDLTIAARYSEFKDTQVVNDSDPDHFNTKNQDADIHAKWYISPNQNILAGISYLKSDFKSGDIKDSKQEIDSYGYYLQHQYNSDKINTQLGVRLEDNDRFGNHTVGQGAIRYHFTPATSVYANIGSAFRAPALTELYYQTSSSQLHPADWQSWHTDPTNWVTSTYNTNGNLNLQPEESVTYEIGFDHHLNTNTKFYLSGYHSTIDNLIAYGTESNDYVNRIYNSSYYNVNEATMKGAEAGVKWAKDSYFASLDYGYVETENKANNLEIAYRPKQTLTLSTGVAKDEYGVNLSLVARSKAFSNGANTERVRGYATVDVGTYWQVTPNAKFFANIENIGNTEYRQVSNFGNGWYVNGGRLTTAGLTLTY
ncbi:TonB-dependent receptor plug domain-containing protein [Moraxella canis]|uniref:TonB-dependent receptor plug domain-containing protein n=1 Tax=Moraxella canis TaxID=90239 RepID=UPI0006677451|nr:TonB-dependent receptor [Moraxella canis]